MMNHGFGNTFTEDNQKRFSELAAKLKPKGGRPKSSKKQSARRRRRRSSKARKARKARTTRRK
jgi:hypothetical protein